MIYIFSNNKKKETNYYNADKECFSYEKPKDWEFMKLSGEVLKNIPDTWKQYPDSETGKMAIVEMEYNELRNTKTKEQMAHEAIHLASACLCLWRKLNNIVM